MWLKFWLWNCTQKLAWKTKFSLNQQTELNIVFFYSFNNKKGKKLKLTISNKKNYYCIDVHLYISNNKSLILCQVHKNKQKLIILLLWCNSSVLKKIHCWYARFSASKIKEKTANCLNRFSSKAHVWILRPSFFFAYFEIWVGLSNTACC